MGRPAMRKKVGTASVRSSWRHQCTEPNGDSGKIKTGSVFHLQVPLDLTGVVTPCRECS